MMCEHSWITTRAVYRTSTPDGYKNHEINRRVCVNCLKTKDEVALEQQLAAANARIAELESNKCETCFDNYAKVTGKLTERAEAAEGKAERQERMIEMACAEWEQVAECNDCLAARTCTANAKGECATEYRRWLEQEAQHG